MQAASAQQATAVALLLVSLPTHARLKQRLPSCCGVKVARGGGGEKTPPTFRGGDGDVNPPPVRGGDDDVKSPVCCMRRCEVFTVCSKRPPFALASKCSYLYDFDALVPAASSGFRRLAEGKSPKTQENGDSIQTSPLLKKCLKNSG